MAVPMHSLRPRDPGTKANSISANHSHCGLLNGLHAVPVAAPRCLILRQHDRQRVRINALLYSGKTFQSVVIRDISQGGAGLQNCSSLIENDKVMLKLMNGRSIAAEVRWWLAGSCGVRFATTLEPNDALLRRFRSAESASSVKVKNGSTAAEDASRPQLASLAGSSHD